MVDGLSVFASMNPQESAVNETETGYGATYTGIEGLTVSYATTDIESGATATSGDHTAMKISCLLYTSPSPRDTDKSRMPSSA